MSKRNTKDIKNISDGNDEVEKPVKRASRKTGSIELTGEGTVTKKRVSKKATAEAAIAVAKNVAVAENDDIELQSLLLQVDHMLTEMTQSKWLSNDWPSLEIDFSKDKK